MVFLDILFGHFSREILNKPSVVYYFFVYLVLFLALLFFQYHNYQQDFYEIKSKQKSISFPKISVLFIFNIIYCYFLFNCAKIPIEYYLISNPQNQILITEEVEIDTGSINIAFDTNYNISKTGILTFELYGNKESLRISDMSKKEFIYKNKNDLGLKIKILKGNLGVFLLKKYDFYKKK